MYLAELSLCNFRNLAESIMTFSSGFNCIFGVNGSGKTSLLEAIYYLGHLRSFRTAQIQRLIHYSQRHFVLYSKLYDQNFQLQTIGIERVIGGAGAVKLAGNSNVKAADLASVLPMVLIHPNSYQLLDHGPKLRRQFIDWGLFYVEPSFYQYWRKFNRLLKQRNAAIRDKLKYDLIAPWDIEYAQLSEKISQLRQSYLKELTPKINQILEKLITIEALSFDYNQGWPKDLFMQDVLKSHFKKDLERGYSYFGPHRADLSIKIGKHPAHEVLSRGQQKLLVIAMRLAQGVLLNELTQKNCLFLLDDITAELDFERRKHVFSLLKEIKAQVFMTLLEANEFSIVSESVSTAMFHVEHGSIISR